MREACRSTVATSRRVDAVELRRTIGYAIQAVGLFAHMTVAQNVAVVPSLLGWPASDIAARVDELLALVGLEPSRYRSRHPRELSGGEAQRVGVARAIAARPRVLLMDEPFGAVDALVRASLQRELARIVRDLGTTTLFVTHDFDEALKLADRIVVMHGGRIEQVAAPGELLDRPATRVRARSRACRRRRLPALLPARARLDRAQGNGRMGYALAHPGKLALLTAAHLEIVAAALAVALLVAVPLGVYAARRPHISSWVLGILGALYTIPSLALLAVLVQLFGLGFAPIFVALVAYAQFMLARSVVAGINGVDRAQVDAARGIGMSPRQILWRVEFPQALPVMLGGVRVAAIAAIAIATLGGYVGGSGLGVLVFNGLTLHQPEMIVAGSLAASALAIAVDALLRLAERRARRAMSS